MLKKILNNATFMSWSSYFVQFGSFLIVLPLLLKVYSDVEVSFWFLTTTIIGFALMADSGFGSALSRAAAYFKAGADYLPRNKKEYDEKDKIESSEPNVKQLSNLLVTSKRIYLFLSLMSALLISAGGTLFIWNIIELSGHRLDLWIAFVILIPHCILAIITIKWSAFMKGLDFIAQEARFSSLLGVIRIILFIILLSFKMKPVFLISIILLLEFFRFLYLRNFVLKWFAKHNISISREIRFDKTIFSSLWAASWRLGGIFWGNYFVEQGNSIIIAQISDAKLMASFLFTTRILEIIKNVSQITFYSKIPTVFKLTAQKNFKSIKSLSSSFMFLGILIMVIAFLLIGIFGDQILNILSISKTFVATNLFVIMALTQLLDMHSSFHAGIYTSTNHIPFLIPSIVSGAIIIALGFYILPIYGLLGIILVRFLVQISFNNWYAMYLSLKLLKWPLYKYIYEFPLIGSKFIINKLKTLDFLKS